MECAYYKRLFYGFSTLNKNVFHIYKKRLNQIRKNYSGTKNPKTVNNNEEGVKSRVSHLQ